MKNKVIKNEEELGAVLKERRDELGITQKQLADHCNLSHNGISQIELARGSVRLSTLLKFGKILGFKVVLKMED